MILKRWLFTASFLGAIVIVKSYCNKRDSGCQRNNSRYENDTTVYPTSTVNCSFTGNLCCYRQGCFDVGMEHWNAMNGQASVRQTSAGCGGNSYSILESPWVNFFRQSCVEFTYSRFTPYQLQVFLAFSNGTQPLKMEDSQPVYNNQIRTASFNIEHLTGKIQFRVRGGAPPNTLKPLKLQYVRITEGLCRNPAVYAHPEASDPSTCDLVTTTLPTTVHNTSSATTHFPSSSREASTSSQPPAAASKSSVSSSPQSSVTDKMTSGKPTEMTGGDGDSDSNVGVIVGVSVAAVAAVIVLVIIVIAYRRKVNARKPDGEKRNLAAISSPAEADNQALGPDDHYEMAEDGAPGQTHNSRTDDFTYIGTGESSHQTHHQANETLDDDYSCIGDTQNMATAGVQGKNTVPAKPDQRDVYSVVKTPTPVYSLAKIVGDKPALPNPNDVYSVVNKPGKKTPTPANNLGKIVGDKPVMPNPNDVYSVVNKKAKKPDLAPTPGHTDTEYNTISHKGNNSSQRAAEDATLDTYNRIGAVASLGSKGLNQESAKAEKVSLDDEYNTLDFADTRQNASRKETSGAARAAYDHVRNDPDDPYSKTQIGKRNVVIGSDYDHVKP